MILYSFSTLEALSSWKRASSRGPPYVTVRQNHRRKEQQKGKEERLDIGKYIIAIDRAINQTKTLTDLDKRHCLGK